jgi:hypothetical protein
MRARAIEDAQKREIVERLLEEWQKLPHERLGQLIVNALPARMNSDPFYVEDYDLIEMIESR